MSLENLFIEAGQRILQLRGNLTQADFAARLGVDRKTVVGWEAGKRLPDGTSLLKLVTEFGADVNYILMGGRASAVPLTAEEQTLLGYYREASKEVRRAALGALIGAPTGSAIHQGGTHSQHSSGAGAIHIGTVGSVPTKRR